MAITFPASAAAQAATVAMPAHSIGDLILVLVWRDGSTTAPTVPTAGGTIPPFAAGGSGVSTTSLLGYYTARATATNHTTGTWTNANGISIVIISGAAGIGPGSFGTGSGTTITYPALTLRNTVGGSYVLRFAGHKSATNLLTNTPAGYTAVTGHASECRIIRSTSAVSSSPATATQAVSPTGVWAALSIEILEANDNATLFSDAFTTTIDTTKWLSEIIGTGSTSTIVSNQLSLNANTFSLFSTNYFMSRDSFHFPNKSVSAQIGTITSTAQNVSFNMFEFSGSPTLFGGYRRGYGVFITGGVATAFYALDGATNNIGTARTHTLNDYYRIRESAGTVYFETSTNGTSWSAWQSTTSGTTDAYYLVDLQTTFTASSQVARFDNFQIQEILVPTNLFFQMF